MAQLWELGVRGRRLDVVAAWKEVVLLGALAIVAWHVRHRPAVKAADILAASYAIVIAVYWLVPQDVLGGDATARGELLALRHHLFPVAAYALGRLVAIAWEERGRMGGFAVLVAVVVAVVGILELALVPLQAWRDSGVPGWYSEQLGLDYEGLSGLPENWVFNTGDEENPIRRLVSTFLSPLASAYALVVALIYVVSRPLRWWWGFSPDSCTSRCSSRTRVRPSPRSRSGSSCSHSRSAASRRPRSRRLRRPERALPRRVPDDRAVHELHASRARVSPPRERERGRAADQGAVPDRGRVHGEPLAEPARRRARRSRASAGTRARKCRRRREAHGRGDQGRRIDVHGTRCRCGCGGRACVRPVEPCDPRRAVAAQAWLFAALASVLVLGLQTDVIGIHWLAFTLWAAAGLARVAELAGG